MNELTLETVRATVAGTAAAFRRITEYQPAGGVGDKLFPPTYEGGRYAVETRLIEGNPDPVDCVLIDSVQSQANRMEAALLETHRSGRITLPLVVAHFDQESLLKKFTVSSLDAPHRVADAIFRDSLLDRTIFRQSEKGRILDTADVRNATGLFGLCPTALVFGLWDSTGPRGGLGAKFQRAIVSEMTGYDAIVGVKTSSRIDPAQIMLGAGPLHHRKQLSDEAPDWTLDSKAGGKKLGRDGKPSEANHGNVTPGINAGGFTIGKAVQTTVLSLTCLRRLRFPLDGVVDSDPAVDQAARSVLAALGLAAAVLSHSEMTDLRSRCQLFPTAKGAWELLDEPGADPQTFSLSPDNAVRLFNDAVTAARDAGLPWDGEIALTPSPELVELVRRSQELAAASGEGDD
ncbi:type I-G CRISPR-associated RAMP protein Csb1/Cas7g [Candidatus Thiosymbion oneisti]|uniref:type I-G CRISPR-associated RAMP protein Csb1/Cas7g n=1 Tax=Candidatus Thiosymbion oneisti TaxID=589554 RepID=UPI000AC31E8F|nr:type I-U CRISPR-associated RAMP protein Csb1/Cas7u [Candidatus Thiosymbion oneisti]